MTGQLRARFFQVGGVGDRESQVGIPGEGLDAEPLDSIRGLRRRRECLLVHLRTGRGKDADDAVETVQRQDLPVQRHPVLEQGGAEPRAEHQDRFAAAHVLIGEQAAGRGGETPRREELGGDLQTVQILQLRLRAVRCLHQRLGDVGQSLGGQELLHIVAGNRRQLLRPLGLREGRAGSFSGTCRVSA